MQPAQFMGVKAHEDFLMDRLLKLEPKHETPENLSVHLKKTHSAI